MITAALEHPGFVPVHEAGPVPNGDPYSLMKLSRGRSSMSVAERIVAARSDGLLPHVIAGYDAVATHTERA